MSVGKICVRDVDLADENEAVWQAAERMHQRVVGSLVVVDKSNKVSGIVTDRDLVERVLAQCRDPNSTLVGAVMTRHPTTVSEEASIDAALELMRTGRFRRLPVVDGEGNLVGLLSLDDVLMRLAETFQQIGGLLEQETPRGVAQIS